MRWKSAPRVFSAIDSRCVPRAQVSNSEGGRSGSPSQPSTPAVSACTQRSFGISGSRPGGAPPDKHGFGGSALRRARGVLAWQRLHDDATGEIGDGNAVKIGGGAIGPEENARWRRDGRVPELPAGRIKDRASGASWVVQTETLPPAAVEGRFSLTSRCIACLGAQPMVYCVLPVFLVLPPKKETPV